MEIVIDHHDRGMVAGAETDVSAGAYPPVGAGLPH